MPEAITLDSIKVESNEEGYGEGYLTIFYCYFKDIPDEKNYYWFKIIENGSAQDGFMVIDDLGFDGKAIEYPLYGTTLESGDQVEIQLFRITKESYEYFKVLF